MHASQLDSIILVNVSHSHKNTLYNSNVAGGQNTMNKRNTTHRTRLVFGNVDDVWHCSSISSMDFNDDDDHHTNDECGTTKPEH